MISTDPLNTPRIQEEWEGLYQPFYKAIEHIFKKEYKNKKDYKQEESINKIELLFEIFKENEKFKKNDKTYAYLENLYTYHDFFIEIGKIIKNY